MYANLRVAVAIGNRIAEYGASEVRIVDQEITIELDGGDGTDEPIGTLVLNEESHASVTITADY